MPTKRLTMRRIHRLMTMHFGAGAGTRVIARELGISCKRRGGDRVDW
jgi:DNA-binding transcriptional regulator LsrR (DeoR family)